MTKLKVNKSKNFCFNCSELNIHVLENPISQRKPLRTGSMGVETHASRQSAWFTAVGPVPRHPHTGTFNQQMSMSINIFLPILFSMYSLFLKDHQQNIIFSA